MILVHMKRRIFQAAFIFLLLPHSAHSETTGGLATESPAPQPEEFKRIEVVFEPDAYYSNIEFILSLTKDPMPRVGEKAESEIYKMLLSPAAIVPRFLLFEASINPLPYLGAYIKKNHPQFYDNAELSENFNWIESVTAGFEEPYALSLLAGNVICFDVAGKEQVTGMGYSGYLFSAGNYHIKENSLIKDRWQEIEWKIKGDRRSPDRKLSWSFRIGAKFHGNPNIADIVYLRFRRSRLDYNIGKYSLLNNSGFEYTIDMKQRDLSPVRHYFYVDKKWPVESRKFALALAVGFIRESADRYTGPLDTGEGKKYTFLLRPNIEF